MWRDERVEVVPTWAQDDARSANSVNSASTASDESYREIDRQLRRIAKKKGRLNVEEAKWLREADRLRVWRELGFSTALEYLEDVFGYAPRTAIERLRVAKELGELRALEANVGRGALPWSAARELTRVMTPETEEAWLARARGKNLRDIELLVAGHKKGDSPDAPKDPALMTRTLLLKLVPRVDALWQQVRRVFEHERGEYIDDVDLFEAVCMRALDTSSVGDRGDEVVERANGNAAVAMPNDSAARAAANDGAGDAIVNDVAAEAAANSKALDTRRSRNASAVKAKGKAPKPMHRIVTHRCDDCMRGWREGRGRLVEIPRADIELAACDAEIVAAVRAAELVDADDAERRAHDDPDDAERRAHVDRDDAERRTHVDLDDAARCTHVDLDDAARCTHVGGDTDVPRTKDGKVRTKRRPPPTLTIPKARRDFVWQRDHGCCRVPGCRATRNLTFHHLLFLSQGGDHAPENLILICDGHHRLLHDGRLTITGTAPDALTFTRNGKPLIDARSASELDAANSLRDQAAVSRTSTALLVTADHTSMTTANAAPRASARPAPSRRRFDEVVRIEQVKQALMQLGFKARAARATAEVACAHVGIKADVGTIVKAALDLERSGFATSSGPRAIEASGPELHVADARQALVQLGYSATIAAAAVQAARAHVGGDVDLVTLITEALRRCTST